MLEWIKELFKKQEYLDWKAFADYVDDMELADFKKKVQAENQKNSFEM